MYCNKILYKVAIFSTLLLTFGILSNGGNLAQAQTPPAPAIPPGGAGTITTATTTIPSNVTALNVYDNSTMVLEFGNGTTLTSPYSNVWSILFLPAGNQTIGNTTTGVETPPGGVTTPEDAAAAEDEAPAEDEAAEAAAAEDEAPPEDEAAALEEEEAAAAALEEEE